VYKPIITVIKDENILRNFPRRTLSDLYLYIVRRWDYLKKRKGPFLKKDSEVSGEAEASRETEVSVKDAAKDFSERYGRKTVLSFVTKESAPEEKLENPYDA
jgi:hypothetical protein